MKFSFLASTLFVFVLVPSIADAAFAGRNDGSASFKATGPAGMQILGTTHDVAVQEDAQNVITITVTLGSLTTGIDLRDKHMREKYLEVQKYPTATFRIPRSDLKVPNAGESGSYDVDGVMSLHGQSRPVRLHYSAKRDAGTAFTVAGSLPLDMTDYGIAAPSYLGVSVKPRVGIDVSFTADDRQ